MLHQRQNSQASGARNRGISALHPASKAVIFLDSDDVFESDAIEQLLAVLERNPSCAAAYGLPRLIDSHGRHIRVGEAESYSRERYRLVPGGIERCTAEDPTTFEVLVLSNCIYTPGQVLIRRRALEQTGAFDPQLTVCADWDYWLRLSSRGELRLLNRVVLGYRQHDANMSNVYEAFKRDEAALSRKFRESPMLTTEQQAMMRRGRRWICRVTSRHWFRWAGESVRAGRYLQAVNQVRHAVLDQLRFYLRGLSEAAGFG